MQLLSTCFISFVLVGLCITVWSVKAEIMSRDMEWFFNVCWTLATVYSLMDLWGYI